MPEETRQIDMRSYWRGARAAVFAIAAMLCSFTVGALLVYEPKTIEPAPNPEIVMQARRLPPESIEMLARAMEACLKSNKDFYFDLVVAANGDQAHGSCPTRGAPARPVDAATASAIGGR